MIEIKSWLGIVLDRSYKKTVKEALEDAVLRGADLRGAVLIGADLRDADLSGAVLRNGIKILPHAEMLNGHARYSWFAVWTDAGLMLQYGCERHTVEAWREKASALAIQHHSDKADEYERITLSLVAFAEAALPKPVEEKP